MKPIARPGEADLPIECFKAIKNIRFRLEKSLFILFPIPFSPKESKMRQKNGKGAMRYAIKNKGLCDKLCDRLCDGTYNHLPITA